MKKRAGIAVDGGTFKARVFRGGAWLGAGSFTEQFARFGRNMLLARLLAPEAFGTMAIIMSATSVAQTLTDVGAREALIQNAKGHEDTHAGAAWWLAFIRALSLYTLLFLGAPLLARFYNDNQLTLLLRVAGIGLLFEGAISSRAYVAMKQLNFRQWATINHGGGIAGVMLTILLSFFLHNVWALVIGACAESILRCLLSFVICPFCPPLRVNRAAVRDLLNFSRGVFGLSALNLIFARTDILVLGKLFSSTDLGLYAMAVYLVQTPVGFIVNVLAQTLMPAFAHIQNDDRHINRILLRVTSMAALLGVPIVVFLVFCGRSVLTLVYGPRYAIATPALIAGACAALLGLINALITIVLYARGLPQLHRRSVGLAAAIVILLIYPAAKYFGTTGGQIAALAAITVGYLFQIERIHAVTRLDLREYTRVLLPSALVSVSMAVVCAAAWLAGGFDKPLSGLLIGLLTSAVAYALSLYVLRTRSKAALWANATSIVS